MHQQQHRYCRAGGSCVGPPGEAPRGHSWSRDPKPELSLSARTGTGPLVLGSSGWLTWALAVLKAKPSGTAFSRAAAKKVLMGPRRAPAKP